MEKSHRKKPTAPEPSEPSIYDQVITFTHTYFGTDSPRYIHKLLKAHMRKMPQDLSKAELLSLLEWIRVAASFLAEDRDQVEKYIQDLFELATSAEPEQPALEQ